MAWLTTRQAAELYGVSERHVRNLCKRGELPCMRLGKLWRVRADAPHRAESDTAQE